MIFTERTISVQKGVSSISDTIILYRGDKGVEIRFTLNEGSPFKFGSGASPNIIEKTEAAYGQLIIKTPNDLPSIFSEVVPTNGGKIVFTITAEMIDEITEVGNYTFQIRLLDESMNSRATLPEVMNGIEIREPIATEDVSNTNEVGVATVGYAMTTAGTTEDAFDSQGNYNKTTWKTRDRITAEKLNKIENATDSINKKANNIPTRISQLENDSDYATITQVNQAIGNAQLGGGGISSNAKTLLISILQNAIYTTDQSANILALQTALSSESGGGTPSATTYDITNNLTNCTNSNVDTSVSENSSYVAIISANEGYTLDNVVITMGGTDITNSVYSNGTINIQNVTGNITITASATQISTSTVITPVWNAGRYINNGVEGDYANYSLSDEIDVSAYNTLKFTTESSQWFGAPSVWYMKTGETNYTLIDNNEGVAYMGGNYASELTYNITLIDKIKIGVNRTDGYDIVKIEGVI